MALAAQGFADRRPTGRVDRRHLRKVFDRIDVIQVDSVNVLVRSQELPLFARLGPHPRTLLADALDDGELFEYWAHMAAHRAERPAPPVPLADGRATTSGPASTALRAAPPGLPRRGPRPHPRRAGRSPPPTSSSASVRRARGGAGTTASSPSSTCSTTGDVAGVRRRSDFARLYDLPERVLPAAALAAPTPTEAEARKELLALAARSLGVATLERPRPTTTARGTPPCRPLVAELVEEGVLRPGARSRAGRKPAYVHRDATRPARGRRRGRCSARSTRWSGTATAPSGCSTSTTASRSTSPAPKRIYGYYVLPFLLGDRARRARRPQGRSGRRRAARPGRLRRAGCRRRPWSPATSPRSCARWPAGSSSTSSRRPIAATSRRRCGARASRRLDVEAAP